MAKDQVTVDQYALPNAKTLQEARDLPLLDGDGNKTTFGAITSPKDDTPRQLVVFIRHFFCGHCEDYIRALTKDLSPAILASATPSTHLTIIGCGQPNVIKDYQTRTKCPYPIYCDPTTVLYDKLGMVVTLDLGPTKPEYLKSNILTGSVSSIMTIFKSGPKKGLAGGKFSQNGGEWIFNDKGELIWCRRMSNTRDHSEMPELVKVLGL